MAEVVDLFAGPGGWSVACARLGLDEIGLDNATDALNTRHAAGHKSLWADLAHRNPVPSDGLIASPPCQTFSAAGKRTGTDQTTLVQRAVRKIRRGEPVDEELADPRTALVLQPLNWVMHTHPRWLVMEQVPDALDIWRSYSNALTHLGYHVAYNTLRTEQYGIPQTRTRAILIAHRDRPVRLPAPTHSKYHSRTPHRLDPGVKPWISMAEALGWEPGITINTRGERKTQGGNLFSADGPSWAVTGKARSWKREQEWVFTRPAPTIVGSFSPETVAKPTYRKTVSRQHQEGSVTITPAQAGILQSFPADYPWCGSRTSQFQQIADAVPPLLAQAVLEEIA